MCASGLRSTRSFNLKEPFESWLFERMISLPTELRCCRVTAKQLWARQITLVAIR